MRPAPVLLILLGVAGVAWCISDPYRVRIALFEIGKLESREQVDWPPSQRPDWHVKDPPEVLAPYRPLALEIAGDGDTLDRARRLLAYAGGLGGPGTHGNQSLAFTSTDDVGQIMEELRRGESRGNCAHYAMILLTLSNAIGIDARIVGIEGVRWVDGAGHALTEVFLPEYGSWVIMDPHFNASFLDAGGRLLSLMDLRELLLAGRSDEVEVVLGEIRARDDPPEQVIAYYQRAIERVVLTGTNNLVERHARVYDSWIGRTLGLSRWPRPIRRAMENLFWSRDRRYLYVDRPELDDPLVPQFVFRASLGVLGIGGLWLAVRLARRRSG